MPGTEEFRVVQDGSIELAHKENDVPASKQAKETA